MKLNSLVFTGVILSSSVYATTDLYPKKPYIGAEFIQTNQRYYNAYGKGVVAKDWQNYNFFTGFNLTKLLGFELGYTFQPQKKKQASLSYGDPAIGNVYVESKDGALIKTYINSTQPYLGVFAGTQLGKIKLKALAGLSFSRINIQLVSKEDDDVATGAYSTYKVIPIIKGIAEYNFHKNFGLRFSVNYSQFSKFNLQSKFAETVGIKLKDQVGVGLGITYSFFNG